jgi:hypothetical protein
MGIPGVTLPLDPIQEQPTYSSALAAFEQLKPIRVLFDNGAGGPMAGAPNPAFEQSWPSFPIPGTIARSWYLSAGRTARRRSCRTAGCEAMSASSTPSRTLCSSPS